jgi:hypothetical protein
MISIREVFGASGCFQNPGSIKRGGIHLAIPVLLWESFIMLRIAHTSHAEILESLDR